MAATADRAKIESGDRASARTALWVIAAAALLFILDFGSAILLPTAYAVVLALVLAPIARWMSKYIGDGPAAALTVLLAAVAIVATIALILPSLTSWLQEAPQLVQKIERKLRPLKEQLEIVEDVSSKIQGATSGPSAAGEGMLGVIVSSGANFLSQLIYVLFLTLFLLALRTDLRRRVILCADTAAGRLRMGHAVRDIGRNVAAYLFILTLINVGVAVVTACAFYAAGVPNALVWGAVYGLANYIPVIGPTGTIVAMALVGVATEATLWAGLMGAGIMLFINAIESQAIQPWLMARRIEINPVAMFVALALVVWLWGVPAAIISTPLLIVAYTFSKYTPALEPIAVALAPVAKSRAAAAEKAAAARLEKRPRRERKAKAGVTPTRAA